MKWTLSDGTVVYLGGKVEGTSALAKKLRRDAKNAKAGEPRMVMTLPTPGSERLKLDDAWHINCWVRDEAAVFHVTVVSAPLDIEAPAEWDEPADPDLGPNPVH